MNNILLVFPPQWVPNHPYLSIPLLSAHLKKSGFKVINRDLNVEFYNNILSKEDLKFTFKKLEERKKTLNVKSILIDDIVENKNIIINNIEKAKKTLRTESFYDFSNFKKSLEILVTGLTAYSLSYPDFYLSFDELKMAYSPFSSKEVYLSLKDKKRNPFIEYFGRYFFNSNFNNTKLFGISIVSVNQLIPGLTLVKEFKTKYPDCKTMIGGNIAKRLSENFKDTDWLWKYLDYLVIGDGENAIKQIAKNVLDKNGVKEKNLKKIPNLIFKGVSKIEETTNAYFNLNNYEFPDYEDCPFELYFSPEPIFSLEFSRGCYWGKCTFCEVANECYREREIKDVIDEISAINKKYKGGKIFFTDIALPILKIIKVFNNKKIQRKNINWIGLFRPEKILLKQHILMRLRNSGCKAALLGLETSSDRVLKIINKGIDSYIYSKILKNLNIHNIWTHCYFMYGLPTETIKEINGTLEFIKYYSNYINSFSVSKYIMLKDTKLFLNSKKYGLSIIKNSHYDWKTAYFNFNPSLSSREVDIINKNINNIFSKYPTDSEKWLYMHINYLFLYISEKGKNSFYSEN